MKKHIVLPAILAVVVGYSSQALATIDITTGGYVEFTAGIFDEEDADNSTHRDFRNEVMVYVEAQGRADNGLSYGAYIEFRNGYSHGHGDEEGSTGNTADVHEAFVTLSDTWGQVQLGDAHGSINLFSVYAPVVDGYGQVDTDPHEGANFSNFLVKGPVTVHAPHSHESTKINYTTPDFSGFQAAITYTPEEDNGQNVVTEEHGDAYHDWIELVARYSHDFGAWNAAVAGGLSTASADELKDFTAWNLGAQVTYGGWSFGGAYVDNDDYAVPVGVDADGYGWNVGVRYASGPFEAGASWLSSNGGADHHATYDDYDAYGVGALYQVAPGLVVQGDLMFANAEVSHDGDSHEHNGWVLMLGTQMTF